MTDETRSVTPEIEGVEHPKTQLPAPTSGALLATIDVEQSLADLERLKEFVRRVLVRGEYDKGADYGPPPGVLPRKVKDEKSGEWVEVPPHDMLFSSGCDKLAETYGLATDPSITGHVWDLTLAPPLISYTVKVELRHKVTGKLISAGIGTCHSWEKKYRWKQGEMVCPECNAPAIRRSSYVPRGAAPDAPKGWWCNPKAGGCNANFPYEHVALRDQKPGRAPNDDTPSLANTILKMATIRAKRAAVLAATRCAGLFNEVYDPDDDDGGDEGARGDERREPEKRSGSKSESQEKKGAPDSEESRPLREHRIVLQGREHMTAGVTEPTIIRCFQLQNELKKATGDADAAKKVIGEALGRHHFVDLTEEQGKTATLLLEGKLARAQKERA